MILSNKLMGLNKAVIAILMIFSCSVYAQAIYKLYNSIGPPIYDYTGSSRAAEVIRGTGLDPVYTSAGVYLNSKNYIIISKKINYDTSSGMYPAVLSFWAYPSKPGVLFAFRTSHNSIESIIKIEFNKNTYENTIMKYYNFRTSSYSPEETSTVKFCNINADGWKLFHVECGVFNNQYFTITLKLQETSTLISFTKLSPGYMYSQGDTYYKIGDETSAWEGFVYQIWWYGASATNTSYFDTKPSTTILSWSSAIDTTAISSTATSACCDVNLYKNPPCPSLSYGQSNTPSTYFNGAGYHDLDKATASGCTGVIRPSTSCSSCIGSSTTTGGITCQSNCSYCNSTSCLECSSNYYIQPTSSTTQCLNTCPTGYYQNTSSTPLRCTQCPDGCLSCSITGDIISCSNCGTTYIQPASSLTLCSATCSAGYYQDISSTPIRCTQCSDGCLSCSITGGILSCTDCGSNKYVQPQINGYTCVAVCNAGYYINVKICSSCSLNNCNTCPGDVCSSCIAGYTLQSGICIQACISNCQACSDSTSCNQCEDGYYLAPQGYSPICTQSCPDGYFKNTETKICDTSCPAGYYKDTEVQECVIKCRDGLYIDTKNLECLTNCPNGYFKNTETKICDTSCPAGYYKDTEVQECVTNCRDGLYIDTQKFECLSSCPDGYFKNTKTFECVLNCPQGYLAHDSTGYCEECKIDRCKECLLNQGLAQVCMSCYDGFMLDNGICISCGEGEYLENGLCYSCPELCTECLSSLECKACTIDSTLVFGECVCQDGFYPRDGKCIKVQANPSNDPQPKKNEVKLLISSDNEVLISFGYPLSRTLGRNDITVEIEGYPYTPNNLEIVQIQSKQSYKIIIQGLNKSLKQASSIKLKLSKDLISSQEIELQESISLSPIDTQGSANSNKGQGNTVDTKEDYLAQDSDAENANFITSVFIQAVTASAISLTILGIDPTGGVWMLINIIQLLSFIPLLNIELPVRLFAVLTALRDYTFIPSYVQYSMSIEVPAPFRSAKLLGYETSQVIYNLGEMISALTLILINYPVFVMIRWLVKRFNIKAPKFIMKRLDNNIKSYKGNVFIRFFIEGYIEIAIAAFLQMRDLSNYGSSSNMICNIVFGIIITVLYIQIFVTLSPFALFSFILKYSESTNNKEFMRTKGCIFEEVDNPKGIETQLYSLIYVLRRLFLSVFFIILRDDPIFQVCGAAFVNWNMFIYMLRFKPLSSKQSNILHIVIDFNISLSYSMTGLFLIEQEGFNKDCVEWIIIGIVAFSFVYVLSINLYNILVAVLRLLRKLRKDKRSVDMNNQDSSYNKSNIVSNSIKISTTNHIESQTPSSPVLLSEVEMDFTIRIDECDRNSI